MKAAIILIGLMLLVTACTTDQSLDDTGIGDGETITDPSTIDDIGLEDTSDPEAIDEEGILDELNDY